MNGRLSWDENAGGIVDASPGRRGVVKGREHASGWDVVMVGQLADPLQLVPSAVMEGLV